MTITLPSVDVGLGFKSLEQELIVANLRVLLVAVIALVIAADVRAEVVSGPGEGAELKSFKVAVVAGESSGKELDFVAERKGKPTVFVFVPADKFARPMARFLKTLDDKLKAERPDVDIVAVWLADDQAKSKEYLPKAQQSLKLERTSWSVFVGEKIGPTDWGINPDADITIVVSDGMKAAMSIGHRSINETEVPKVVAKLPAKK